MPKTELQNLLLKLDSEPTNLDILNKLALFYFENYDLKSDKEDYDYFEKAYNIQKTVKSTHNFAWFLYFEWSEIEWRWNKNNSIERALEIQKECINLLPKSHYPYYQYGYMLLDQMKFENAIPFLINAYEIEKQRDILHNIGYCHFHLGDFQNAKDFFTQSTTHLDAEKRSLYNLALTEWRLNNSEQVKLIADNLYKHIKSNIHETISGYEIGLLYFLLGNYQKASECLIKQGINGIDLMDWTYLSFSLFKTDYKLWNKKINETITERKHWCNEIENNHQYWSDYTDLEKNERLIELKEEIKIREDVLCNGMAKPIQDLSKDILVEYCGCLLFDCERHNNKQDD